MASIPSSFASYIRRGFSVLAGIPPVRYPLLIEQVVDSIDSPMLRGEEKLASQFGVKEEDASPLLAAVSLVCVSMSATDETPESFVTVASEVKIVDEAHKASLLELTGLVARSRGRLKEDLQKSRTALRILPALTDFETAVDVRPIFKRDEIASTVPVTLVHIDTDTTHHEIWFQMSKTQLKFVIENLQDSLRRIELLERWAEGGRGVQTPPNKGR